MKNYKIKVIKTNMKIIYSNQNETTKNKTKGKKQDKFKINECI